MTSFIVRDESVFGVNYTKVIVEGHSSKELRESFEQALKDIRPEPNRMQKLAYGEDHLNKLPDHVIKKLVANNSGMGNTTAQAMRQIADALKAPGVEIPLVHDHGEGMAFVASYYNFVQEIIKKLDLHFLVINTANRTLKFDV